MFNLSLAQNVILSIQYKVNPALSIALITTETSVVEQLQMA